MTEYVDIFRMEAKSLLRNFQKQEKDAIARCKAVFGDRKDLSLMNMQHVIAKEAGFNQWNELTKADDCTLAEIIVATDNTRFKTPFRKILGKYGSIEGAQVPSLKTLPKERAGLDLVNFKMVYNNNTCESPWLYLNNMDLSEYNLSHMNPIYTTYNESTCWPNDKTKMPQHFDPKKFMEKRKNPGLGIRTLHKQGIKGQNRAVAIIDWQILYDHLEYHHNLKEYEEIHQSEHIVTSPANALVSALVGKNCGIAPNADVYYFSVNHEKRTQRYYAQALNKICNLHKKLKNEGKNGIDTVCIPAAVTSLLFAKDDGADLMAQALEQAQTLGIWVNSGRLNFIDKSSREGSIHCQFDGNEENPNDYIPLPNEPQIPPSEKNLFKKTLCFPAGGRTVATNGRLNSYQFTAPGYYLKLYESGLYLLAKSVKDSLTPEEFWSIGLETGDFREGIGIIINPQRLIEKLKK